MGEVTKPCPCLWLNSPFNLLMELLFGPVRDFDGAVEEEVLLGGEVTEQDIVLHANAHVLPNSV